MKSSDFHHVVDADFISLLNGFIKVLVETSSSSEKYDDIRVSGRYKNEDGVYKTDLQGKYQGLELFKLVTNLDSFTKGMAYFSSVLFSVKKTKIEYDNNFSQGLDLDVKGSYNQDEYSTQLRLKNSSPTVHASDMQVSFNILGADKTFMRTGLGFQRKLDEEVSANFQLDWKEERSLNLSASARKDLIGHTDGSVSWSSKGLLMEQPVQGTGKFSYENNGDGSLKVGYLISADYSNERVFTAQADISSGVLNALQADLIFQVKEDKFDGFCSFQDLDAEAKLEAALNFHKRGVKMSEVTLSWQAERLSYQLEVVMKSPMESLPLAKLTMSMSRARSVLSYEATLEAGSERMAFDFLTDSDPKGEYSEFNRRTTMAFTHPFHDLLIPGNISFSFANSWFGTRSVGSLTYGEYSSEFEANTGKGIEGVVMMGEDKLATFTLKADHSSPDEEDTYAEVSLYTNEKEKANTNYRFEWNYPRGPKESRYMIALAGSNIERHTLAVEIEPDSWMASLTAEERVLFKLDGQFDQRNVFSVRADCPPLRMGCEAVYKTTDNQEHILTIDDIYSPAKFVDLYLHWDDAVARESKYKHELRLNLKNPFQTGDFQSLSVEGSLHATAESTIFKAVGKEGEERYLETYVKYSPDMSVHAIANCSHYIRNVRVLDLTASLKNLGQPEMSWAADLNINDHHIGTAGSVNFAKVPFEARLSFENTYSRPYFRSEIEAVLDLSSSLPFFRINGTADEPDLMYFTLEGQLTPTGGNLSYSGKLPFQEPRHAEILYDREQDYSRATLTLDIDNVREAEVKWASDELSSRLSLKSNCPKLTDLIVTHINHVDGRESTREVDVKLNEKEYRGTLQYTPTEKGLAAQVRLEDLVNTEYKLSSGFLWAAGPEYQLEGFFEINDFYIKLQSLLSDEYKSGRVVGLFKTRGQDLRGDIRYDFEALPEHSMELSLRDQRHDQSWFLIVHKLRSSAYTFKFEPSAITSRKGHVQINWDLEKGSIESTVDLILQAQLKVDFDAKDLMNRGSFKVEGNTSLTHFKSILASAKYDSSKQERTFRLYSLVNEAAMLDVSCNYFMTADTLRSTTQVVSSNAWVNGTTVKLSYDIRTEPLVNIEIEKGGKTESVGLRIVFDNVIPTVIFTTSFAGYEKFVMTGDFDSDGAKSQINLVLKRNDEVFSLWSCHYLLANSRFEANADIQLPWGGGQLSKHYLGLTTQWQDPFILDVEYSREGETVYKLENLLSVEEMNVKVRVETPIRGYETILLTGQTKTTSLGKSLGVGFEHNRVRRDLGFTYELGQETAFVEVKTPMKELRSLSIRSTVAERLGEFSFDTNSVEEDFAFGLKYDVQPDQGGVKIKLDLGGSTGLEEFDLVEAGFDYKIDEDLLSGAESTLYFLASEVDRYQARFESSPGLASLSVVTPDDSIKTGKIEVKFGEFPTKIQLDVFQNDEQMVSMAYEMLAERMFQLSLTLVPEDTTFVVELSNVETLYRAIFTMNGVMAQSLEADVVYDLEKPSFEIKGSWKTDSDDIWADFELSYDEFKGHLEVTTPFETGKKFLLDVSLTIDGDVSVTKVSYKLDDKYFNYVSTTAIEKKRISNESSVKTNMKEIYGFSESTSSYEFLWTGSSWIPTTYNIVNTVDGAVIVDVSANFDPKEDGFEVKLSGKMPTLFERELNLSTKVKTDMEKSLLVDFQSDIPGFESVKAKVSKQYKKDVGPNVYNNQVKGMVQLNDQTLVRMAAGLKNENNNKKAMIQIGVEPDMKQKLEVTLDGSATHVTRFRVKGSGDLATLDLDATFDETTLPMTMVVKLKATDYYAGSANIDVELTGELQKTPVRMSLALKDNSNEGNDHRITFDLDPRIKGSFALSITTEYIFKTTTFGANWNFAGGEAATSEKLRMYGTFQESEDEPLQKVEFSVNADWTREASDILIQLDLLGEAISFIGKRSGVYKNLDYKLVVFDDTISFVSKNSIEGPKQFDIAAGFAFPGLEFHDIQLSLVNKAKGSDGFDFDGAFVLNGETANVYLEVDNPQTSWKFVVESPFGLLPNLKWTMTEALSGNSRVMRLSVDDHWLEVKDNIYKRSDIPESEPLYLEITSSLPNLTQLKISFARGEEEKEIQVKLNQLLDMTLRGRSGDGDVLLFDADIMFGGMQFTSKGEVKVRGPEKHANLNIALDEEEVFNMRLTANLSPSISTDSEINLAADYGMPEQEKDHLKLKLKLKNEGPQKREYLLDFAIPQGNLILHSDRNPEGYQLKAKTASNLFLSTLDLKLKATRDAVELDVDLSEGNLKLRMSRESNPIFVRLDFVGDGKYSFNAEVNLKEKKFLFESSVNGQDLKLDASAEGNTVSVVLETPFESLRSTELKGTYERLGDAVEIRADGKANGEPVSVKVNFRKNPEQMSLYVNADLPERAMKFGFRLDKKSPTDFDALVEYDTGVSRGNLEFKTFFEDNFATFEYKYKLPDFLGELPSGKGLLKLGFQNLKNLQFTTLAQVAPAGSSREMEDLINLELTVKVQEMDDIALKLTVGSDVFEGLKKSSIEANFRVKSPLDFHVSAGVAFGGEEYLFGAKLKAVERQGYPWKIDANIKAMSKEVIFAGEVEFQGQKKFIGNLYEKGGLFDMDIKAELSPSGDFEFQIYPQDLELEIKYEHPLKSGSVLLRGGDLGDGMIKLERTQSGLMGKAEVKSDNLELNKAVTLFVEYGGLEGGELELFMRDRDSTGFIRVKRDEGVARAGLSSPDLGNFEINLDKDTSSGILALQTPNHLHMLTYEVKEEPLEMRLVLDSPLLSGGGKAGIFLSAEQRNGLFSGKVNFGDAEIVSTNLVITDAKVSAKLHLECPFLIGSSSSSNKHNKMDFNFDLNTLEVNGFKEHAFELSLPGPDSSTGPNYLSGSLRTKGNGDFFTSLKLRLPLAAVVFGSSYDLDLGADLKGEDLTLRMVSSDGSSAEFIGSLVWNPDSFRPLLLHGEIKTEGLDAITNGRINLKVSKRSLFLEVITTEPYNQVYRVQMDGNLISESPYFLFRVVTPIRGYEWIDGYFRRESSGDEIRLNANSPKGFFNLVLAERYSELVIPGLFHVKSEKSRMSHGGILTKTTLIPFENSGLRPLVLTQRTTASSGRLYYSESNTVDSTAASILIVDLEGPFYQFHVTLPTNDRPEDDFSLQLAFSHDKKKAAKAVVQGFGEKYGAELQYEFQSLLGEVLGSYGFYWRKAAFGGSIYSHSLESAGLALEGKEVFGDYAFRASYDLPNMSLAFKSMPLNLTLTSPSMKLPAEVLLQTHLLNRHIDLRYYDETFRLIVKKESSSSLTIEPCLKVVLLFPSLTRFSYGLVQINVPGRVSWTGKIARTDRLEITHQLSLNGRIRQEYIHLAVSSSSANVDIVWPKSSEKTSIRYSRNGRSSHSLTWLTNEEVVFGMENDHGEERGVAIWGKDWSVSIDASDSRNLQYSQKTFSLEGHVKDQVDMKLIGEVMQSEDEVSFRVLKTKGGEDDGGRRGLTTEPLAIAKFETVPRLGEGGTRSTFLLDFLPKQEGQRILFQVSC